MKTARVSMKTLALGSCAFGALLAAAAPAAGAEFAVAPQELQPALQEFAAQGDQQVLFSSAAVAGKRTSGFSGEAAPETALQQLLSGTDLVWSKTTDGALLVMTQAEAKERRPQFAQAAEGGSDGTVEALIVTAQKREEDIQDVPIAISAFTQETLERSQIAGGPDLMTQVPNMTFTKTNFSSYSIQIRGIGTQAISATTDPAVAVAFNNTPFIRNRFFEQEFYDLQRVEVLRGPQGTLYGRNATAGVVNLLTARPTHRFEAKLTGDVANYSTTRLEGMINVPLVEDRAALRVAGAWTKRDGYATNQMTGEQIDGRDLWSARVTLGVKPADGISAYLTYEHFEEDDDRIRSGKQLCKKDPNPTVIGGVPVPDEWQVGRHDGLGSYTSQGCEAVSLYSAEAFQTPNAFALPYYSALHALALPVDHHVDPYLHADQSRDLRVIESSIEPHYRAKADLVHLQINFDIGDSLTLTSETAYSNDFVFSTQDYNRFTTSPQAFTELPFGSAQRSNVILPGRIFCDPQLGCSDRILVGDLATSESDQFSQEFRLNSDFDGRLNFSAGVNFLRHDAVDKYYVFLNTITMFAALGNSQFFDGPYVPGVTDNTDCMPTWLPGDPSVIHEVVSCIYIDPNPIGSLNDQGHNYFLSKNPYRLISYAGFGEVYFNITDTLKLTGGLRWTVDKKHAPEIPSWLLAGNFFGYPVANVVDQEWREPTGRLTLDWKPSLAFTDETLLYASYAHGYKAGGANPPRPVIPTYADIGVSTEVIQAIATHPKTFEPEFVDAFEVGTKNTLLGGALTANANAFYYDYRGYQISEIVNRAALNRNFDAEVWGVELELDWRPLENLRFAFKGGWERTRVADGEQVIDLMDRTAGDPNYMVVKAFPSIPSNCIIPVQWGAESVLGVPDRGIMSACNIYYGAFGGPAAFDLEDVPNNGEGLFKDLSGNELPNAPEFTTTLTVDYTLPLPNEWLATLHADYYRQSEAWWRIINADPYDRLQPYQTVNFAAIFTNEASGWNVMAFVKNAFDETAITGAFLNSDDTGLTTNVFLTEPRLYGLRVTKAWSGEPFWVVGTGSDGPYPLRVELGGGVQRIDAPNEAFTPEFLEGAAAELQGPLALQDENLDWGDAREVRLIYRPQGAWSLSAGYRKRETNGRSAGLGVQHTAGGYTFSDELVAMYPFLEQGHKYVAGAANFTNIDHYDQEEWALADFSVGRDVGIGVFGQSVLSVGLQYGSFRSTSRTTVIGTTDHEGLPAENAVMIGPDGIKYVDQRIHRYTADHRTEREFKGWGPTVSWETSKSLIGGDDSGRLGLEVGAGASVLFGKQQTRSEFTTEDRYAHYGPLNLGILRTLAVTEGPSGGREGSNSETVYGVGANLGLSYEVGRMKVSGGYRFDKFFNVLDAGVEAERQEDRTYDGPYFKLSVGFGS